MKESQLFDIIDVGIGTFKNNDGYKKRIKVSKRPHSDWLIFNWRQLTWKQNDLAYLIEIYPHFDDQQNISSWTLYSAAFYDLDKRRFYMNFKAADKVSLDYIANNIYELLCKSYHQIMSIKKEDIPGVDDREK